MPLILALGGRDRWIPEFEASLVHRASPRTARTTQRNPVSKRKKKSPKKRAVGEVGRTGVCAASDSA